MSKGRMIAVSALVLMAVGGLVMEGSTPDVTLRLPDDVALWRVAEDTVYTRDTIYGYIDGGAELYLSYGFSSVRSRTYTREGAQEIVVDVFDMAEPRNAFGVFTHSRETIDDTFGQGSQYTPGLLVFWKDRYYVSILASPETEDGKAAVFELARRIDEAIPDEGALPAVLEFLPSDSLVEESIRYFRHHVWLNSHYYVADENVLHIDDTTEAVLAKYRVGGTRAIVVVVEYPDEKAALLARSDFVEQYLPEAGDAGVARIEDSTWAGCRLAGRVLAAVFNAPTKETAAGLLEKVESIAESKRSGDRGFETR
jgi:hypothetical protein